jgi:uncharacterized membrane protein YesL
MRSVLLTFAHVSDHIQKEPWNTTFIWYYPVQFIRYNLIWHGFALTIYLLYIILFMIINLTLWIVNLITNLNVSSLYYKFTTVRNC